MNPEVIMRCCLTFLAVVLVVGCGIGILELFKTYKLIAEIDADQKKEGNK